MGVKKNKKNNGNTNSQQGGKIANNLSFSDVLIKILGLTFPHNLLKWVFAAAIGSDWKCHNF